MTIIFLLITITFFMLCMLSWPTIQSRTVEKCYIVQVKDPSSGAQLTSMHPEDLMAHYNSLFLSPLATTMASSNNQDPPLIIHAYSHAITGFAAAGLTEDEAKELEKMEGVMSVRPEKTLFLQTTHSPSFLGLNQDIGGLWRSGSNYGMGIVIGILDTGIMPDHPSFSDDSMPSLPSKWKGKPCQLKAPSCNKKIIRASSFVRDDQTALDYNGHGTHTSSTAAGNFVEGANVYGNAQGTASGIAPLAHLSIYKVCTAWEGCMESAILAGIEAAIEDGVDVLSISIGNKYNNFYDDLVAIAAFRAMEKGILVSLPVGNNGSDAGSLINTAPWALTVGASTTDREIRATVVLGNNQEEFHGQTAFQPEGFTNEPLPLAEWSNATNFRREMVVRDHVDDRAIEEGEEVINAGGAAVILVNNEKWGNTTTADAHVLPAANVGYEDGLKIRAYIRGSTETPVAKFIFGGTVIGDINNNNPAPVVAAFSSRGPNRQSPGILKPDILGPGVNILAAWPTSVDTNTTSTFNIISGTSMACTHLNGVAALLKSAHPNWSPAAIKSAIITTANDLNQAHRPIKDGAMFLPANIFATGAGQVNPQAASEPGLIYDIQPQDYIAYLCGLKYTDEQVQLITKISCTGVQSVPEAQLKYPSFALTFTGPETNPQTYTRMVTNVGDPRSSYNVTVVPPPGIEVRVAPEELKFSKLNQKINYTVTFSRNASVAVLQSMAVKGFLKLCSSNQCVTSPIAVILRP